MTNIRINFRIHKDRLYTYVTHYYHNKRPSDNMYWKCSTLLWQKYRDWSTIKSIPSILFHETSVRLKNKYCYNTVLYTYAIHDFPYKENYFTKRTSICFCWTKLQNTIWSIYFANLLMLNIFSTQNFWNFITDWTKYKIFFFQNKNQNCLP